MSFEKRKDDIMGMEGESILKKLYEKSLEKFVMVKREDLDRLFFVLDWELNMDALTHKDYKYINKFKEVYGIE